MPLGERMLKVFSFYRSVTSLALVVSVSACNDTTLGGGYKIIHQGGSKHSLAKDNLVLIDYVVTGFSRHNENILVERRPSESETCNYAIIRQADSEPSLIVDIDQDQIKAYRDYFTSINDLSCLDK